MNIKWVTTVLLSIFREQARNSLNDMGIWIYDGILKIFGKVRYEAEKTAKLLSLSIPYSKNVCKSFTQEAA